MIDDVDCARLQWMIGRGQPDRNVERNEFKFREAGFDQMTFCRPKGSEVQRVTRREVIRTLDQFDILIEGMEEIERDHHAAGPERSGDAGHRDRKISIAESVKHGVCDQYIKTVRQQFLDVHMFKGDPVQRFVAAARQQLGIRQVAAG